MTIIRRPPKYVQAWMDKEGRPYFYLRRPGYPRVKLPGLPWSPQFMAAYEAAQIMPKMIGASRTKPGSVSAAIVGFYTSLEFRSLSAQSQSMRRAILERFRADYGDYPMGLLPQKFLVAVLSSKKPFAARNWLKSLRALIQFAVAQEMCPADVTQGIKLPRVKSAGHHTWSEAEIEQYEAYHAVGTKARLALALPLYTAQRRGDVIRMGPQHIRDGVITVRQQKTGVTLAIPVPCALQAVFDATPCEHLTFLTTRTGKPYAGNDLPNSSESGATRLVCLRPARCTGYARRHVVG